MTISAELDEKLSGLKISNENEKFKEIIRDYGGIWDKFDEATNKFDELLDSYLKFTKILGTIDGSKEYEKLSNALKNLIIILSWFEENENKIIEQCGSALEDINEKLKEIDHIRKIIESL